MTSPSLERVNAALATVNDPEIRRPITEIGMVDDVSIGDDGRVGVTVLLTVSGCPMKDTLTRDVTNAVSAVEGVSGVDVTLDVMSDEQRQELQQTLRGGQPAKEIPFARPDSLTQVIAVASGKGGVGKSSVTVNLALAMARAGRKVGVLDADIYGHSVPAMLGVADERPTQVEEMIMPVPALGLSVISIGMLKPRRDQVVAWRGPMLDRALVQMLSDVYWGDLDVLLLDLPPGTGDVPMSVGQHLPERRGRGRHHPAGGGVRGGRASRDDGVDDEPEGDGRDREHVLPRLPALRSGAPDQRVRHRRRHSGRRHAVRPVRLRRPGARRGAPGHPAPRRR